MTKVCLEEEKCLHAHIMMHWLERATWEEAKEPNVISFPTSLNVLLLGLTVRGWELIKI